MNNPFPGMDPWLEHPAVWPGVHVGLIHVSVELLLPQLRPRGYFADKNQRILIDDSERQIGPDVTVIRRPTSRGPETTASVSTVEADEPVRVRSHAREVREFFIEIFDQDRRRLITSIEFLSPSNKRSRSGRRQFQRKRRELQAGDVNVVEIDLLRGGPHALGIREGNLAKVGPWDYLACVWRPGAPDEYEVYPIPLRQRLPRIRIPLKSGEADVVLDLQAALNRSYESGPYPDRLDYQSPPQPPLNDDDAVWTDEVLRSAGLRKAPSAPPAAS